MTTKDFLLELGCEELPAEGLNDLAGQLAKLITAGLNQAQLTYGHIQHYATPRRLAVLVNNLSQHQPDINIEKRGPVINAPLAAQEGFARSCQTSIDQLQQENGYWIYRGSEPGKATEILLPEITQKAISQLTAPKMMRWGNNELTFSRPVHWIVMLYGDELITTTLLGKKTSRETRGHRFHHPGKLTLTHAKDYAETLSEEGFVTVDFAKRKEQILDQIHILMQKIHCKAVINPALLDEVVGLVEYPVALLCQFPAAFLQIPKEALISAMQFHQKSFPVVNAHDEIQPLFVAVSNIQSKNPQQVISGNERVMRARLADAAFFYEQDQKQRLEQRFDALKQVTFQKHLGSIAEKVMRNTELAKEIAKLIHADANLAIRACHLSKCDLLTNMVNEFPELQGIMGEYYAQNDKENPEVAIAIREQYLPKHAGDKLPKTSIGCILALADRIDTLIGIFGIKQIPTGDKDPFGLRRAALGIVRITIEKQLSLVNLQDILEKAAKNYQQHLTNTNVITEVKQYILDRLPAYYQEQNIPVDTVHAVLAVEQNHLENIHQRILALQTFRQYPEAAALAEANKRVKNILHKNNQLETKIDLINQNLFELAAEKNLYQLIQANTKNNTEHNYAEILKSLAAFKEPLDIFFIEVMVEVEDKNIKQNRLSLLKALRALFLQVADISLLQIKS